MKDASVLTIEKLDGAAFDEIYFGDMQSSFPAAELKPYKMMKDMLKAGLMSGYGGFIDNRMAAYAYFIGNDATILLDYFAVLPAFRAGGVGSQFLTGLQSRFSNSDYILFEVETPPSDDPALTENRRIAFYRRLGVRLTPIKSFFFGVDFTVLYLPLKREAEPDEICRRLKNIYLAFLSPEAYRKNINLRLVR